MLKTLICKYLVEQILNHISELNLYNDNYIITDKTNTIVVKIVCKIVILYQTIFLFGGYLYDSKLQY